MVVTVKRKETGADGEVGREHGEEMRVGEWR